MKINLPLELKILCFVRLSLHKLKPWNYNSSNPDSQCFNQTTATKSNHESVRPGTVFTPAHGTNSHECFPLNNRSLNRIFVYVNFHPFVTYALRDPARISDAVRQPSNHISPCQFSHIAIYRWLDLARHQSLFKSKLHQTSRKRELAEGRPGVSTNSLSGG